MSILYDYFVGKNLRVKYEYERYVKEHLDEHYLNRFKHFRLLAKLNIEYRLKKRKVPYIYWDAPMGVENDDIVKPFCPKISVVIASYNYEKYICETLDSVFSQTYKNFEVIVIDDGSTDNSLGVLRNYVRTHPQYSNLLVFTHAGHQNLGLPQTVKLGVEKASGEFVAFCESDDRWKPNHLDKKIEILNLYPNANIVLNNVEVFGDHRIISKAANISDEFVNTFCEYENEISPELCRERNVIPSFSCCMVRREELKKCDFLSVPRKSNLDWWLWRQLLYTNKAYCTHAKLTEWRMHSDSYLSSENKLEYFKMNEFKDSLDLLLVNKHPEIESVVKSIVYLKKNISFKNGDVYCSGDLLSDQPFFSIILPTYNRKNVIGKAIDSALNQTYSHFELIIVDDGSDDGTIKFLKKNYKQYIDDSKIRIFTSKKVGVSKARNIGLANAKGKWIAYLDSDNIIMNDYLQSFLYYIISNPDKKNFYARSIMMSSGKCKGRHFNYDLLLQNNYIDMGTYVHSRELIDECGGFDESMTRLVDWDLIVTHSSKYIPYYIDRIVLIYNDDPNDNRITNNVRMADNMCVFRNKHCTDYPSITTLILSYNHEKYISQAIESALMQQGLFRYEILISDDGSTDSTRKIINMYSEEYPHLIKNISSKKNYGISANMKKGFMNAKGKYVAILEGDDYWASEWKLNRQAKFLEQDDSCNLVFSRIKVYDEKNNTFSVLSRQRNLPKYIDGNVILNTECQNPIANFSSCMFRTKVIQNIPDCIYENRINEIVLAMYLEKIGKIGYIPDLLSVYRMHGNGTWTGMNDDQKQYHALDIRKKLLQICDEKYKHTVLKIVNDLERSM